MFPFGSKIMMINFQKQDNLLPVIFQEETTGDVLMLGYMNKEALEMTKKEGIVYFWSRKRNRLWMKGETSGNKLRVKKILTDCDNDTLLLQVELIGMAVCHLGTRSCFRKYEI